MFTLLVAHIYYSNKTVFRSFTMKEAYCNSYNILTTNLIHEHNFDHNRSYS